MRDVLLTVVIGGLIPFAAFNPFVGVLLWTWLSVMNPHRLTWGFAYHLPFAQTAAIATLLGLVVAHRKLSFPITPLTSALFAFLAWITVTLPLSIYPDSSIEMWSRVSKTLFMTLVALAVVISERQIRLFLWVLVLSVAFFGIKGGVFVIVTGGEDRVYGPPGSHITDNNEVSIALLMMIPLLIFLHGQARQLWLKWSLVAATLLCAVSVVASYSRGAFVAGVAMLIVLAIKSRRRLALLVMLGVAVAGTLVSMPQKWWDRMDTITLENPDQSIQGRLNAWGMTWNLALDRPIVGGGFAIYEPDVYARYAPNPLDLHSAHSIYFQMMGEHGFVGLALYLLLAFLMWRTASRVIRGSRAPDALWRGDLARAIQVSMVGFFVGGLTVNIAYWDVYYFLIVLLAALERLRVRGAAPLEAPSRAFVPTASSAMPRGARSASRQAARNAPTSSA